MNTSQDGFGSYLIYFPNPNNLTSKGGVGFLKTKSTSYIERLRDLRNYEAKVVAVCLIHSSNLKFQIPIVLFYVRRQVAKEQGALGPKVYTPCCYRVL